MPYSQVGFGGKISLFMSEDSKTLSHVSTAICGAVNKYSMILFYLAFALYSATAWLNSTVLQFSNYPAGETIELIIQLIVIATTLLLIMFREVSFLSKLIRLVLVAVGFVVWYIAKEGSLFWASLLIVSAPEFDPEKLSKLTICVILATIALSSLVVLLGIFPMSVRVRSDNGAVRYALGFLHPNNLGTALATLSFAFCVLRFNSFKVHYIPLYLLLAMFTYLVPVSRTAAILIVVTIFTWTCYVFTNRRKLRIPYAVILFALFVMALGASLVIMFGYDSLGSLVAPLNKVLSSRPYMAKKYFDESGITLFGYSFANGPFVNNDGKVVNFLVDNAFDHVFLKDGLLPFLGLFGMLAAVYIKGIINHEGIEVVFGLTMFMLMAITERGACQIECNYLLVAIAFVFDGNRLLKSPPMPSVRC